MKYRILITTGILLLLGALVVLAWQAMTVWSDEGELIGNHGGPVMSLAGIQNTTTVVSGSRDKSIVLWDYQKLQKIGTLDGQDDAVSSLCASKDGALLASASGSFRITEEDHRVVPGPDLDIYTWDLRQLKFLKRLKGHEHYVASVACLSNNVLVSGSWDKTFRIWEILEERQIERVQCTDFVQCVSASPDGQLIAAGAWNGDVICWDMATRRIRFTGKHNSAVASVSFSANGQLIAAGSTGYNLR